MLNGYHIAALCVSRIHDEENVTFIANLNSLLVEKDWRLMCFTTDSDLYSETVTEAGELQVYDLLDFDVIDAVIFSASTSYIEQVKLGIINRALKASKPVFVVDESIPNCYSVRFDYRTGFKKVVRHVLKEHNVKDIHFLAGVKENPYSIEREDVMYELTKEFGVGFGPERISYGNFWSEPAKAAVQKLIDEGRVPRALICANDSMAFAASNLLQANGYRIPEDVIITGFDGMTGIYYSHPKITSCHSDYRLLAAKVFDKLLEHFSGRKTEREALVEPQLIVQESCGCTSSVSVSDIDYISEHANSFQRYHGESRYLEHFSMKLQTCENRKQLYEIMKQDLFYDMICVVKEEVLEPTNAPLKVYTETTYGDRLITLYDSERRNETYERELKAEAMLPRMEELLEEKRPLIFIALNYLNIPLGYLCFHFREFNRQSLMKVGQIATILNTAIGGYRNMQYQCHIQKMIEDRLRYDAVTGLHTRISFLNRYDEYIEEHKPELITMVMCDLDDLKGINDNYSHTEGDIALSVVADALHNTCYEGLCCRYGGDEMVAILIKPCDPDKLRVSITEYISDFNEKSGKPYKISASVGIFQTTDTDLDHMFEEADQMMYEVKKQHKKAKRQF